MQPLPIRPQSILGTIFKGNPQRDLSMRKKTAGRPSKFSEPSRPVTVTLPERVLNKLQQINSDRGQAITKAVDILVADSRQQRPPLEIVPICDGQGMIVIGYSKVLSRIPGVQLVEISPLRYLISLQPGGSVDAFELALIDLLDHLPPGEESETDLLQDLRKVLMGIRHKQGVTKAEILLVPTV